MIIKALQSTSRDPSFDGDRQPSTSNFQLSKEKHSSLTLNVNTTWRFIIRYEPCFCFGIHLFDNGQVCFSL